MIEVSFFDRVFDYVLSFDAGKTLRVFWFYFFFDFPRYLLTDFYLLFYKLFARTAERTRLFTFKLQNTPPLVSVIIPVLNEEETIAWTVRSLKEQTYKNLQIIIIDDGSTDRTPNVCKELQQLGGILSVRFNERAGKSAALNYGLKFATGEYVIFVDSDSTFDRDAIFNMIKEFANPKVGAVAGNLLPRNRRANLLTRLQFIEYLYTISVGRMVRAHLDILPVISGAFGGFRRDIIAIGSIGGQEPGPGNDSDLTIRVRKLGYKIAFAADALCLTNVPETMDKLIRQRWRWDRNLIKNRMRKHKDVFNPFSRSFRLCDVVSFIDSIFYHVVLAFLTVFYLIDVFIHYPDVLPFVFTLNYILYFMSEFIEYMIAVVLLKRWDFFGNAVYLFAFNPYKIYMKLLRVIGYCQELLFKYSYHDPFAPFKVRQRMIRW